MQYFAYSQSFVTNKLLLFLFSLPADGLLHRHVHVQHEHVGAERMQRGRRRGCRPEGRRRPVPADPAPKAPSPLHPGPGVRARAPLQAAEVSLGPRTRAPGQPHPPHAHPGQDMVPEPPLQVQEASEREGNGRAAAVVVPEKSSRARAGEGRQALLDGFRGRRRQLGRPDGHAVGTTARAGAAAPPAAGLRRGFGRGAPERWQLPWGLVCAELRCAGARPAAVGVLARRGWRRFSRRCRRSSRGAKRHERVRTELGPQCRDQRRYVSIVLAVAGEDLVTIEETGFCSRQKIVQRGTV